MLSPLGVRASDLKVGGAYYIVTYVDDALAVPEVESVIFLGESIEGASEGILCFQDAWSFHQVGAYPDINKSTDDVSERVRIIEVPAAELPPNFFPLHGLIDELSRVATRGNSI